MTLIAALTIIHQPVYYVYPGLNYIHVPLAKSYFSPEERLDFIMRIVKEEFGKRYPFDIEKMMTSTREMPYAIARMAFYPEHFYFTNKE